MSFVDLRFLLFFPAVAILNVLVPQRWRWVLLLVASYIFYMAWKPEYGLLLLLITSIDFAAGLLMSKTSDERRRLFFLVASLVGNLGLLFFFKYFNFVFASLTSALAAIGTSATFPVLDILLPIGISFHVFQSLSYTIDVYRRKVAAVHHFGKFALYVSFFPQLVAGPIERPQRLLKQFFEDRRFNLPKAQEGVLLVLWGYFKKLVIADNIAPLVNAAYAAPTAFPGPTLALATVLFAYQIYCDFSGYSDIARGTAKILGYDLMKNFDRPYASLSIGEFWRRWHISLSTWFRDYLYVPLGGNTFGAKQTYRNLMMTFLSSGLWHGANWTFVIWGGLNGIYIVIQRAVTHTTAWMPARLPVPILSAHMLQGEAPTPLQMTKTWANAPEWSFARVWGRSSFVLRRTAQHILIFSLICLTWIFFRAQTITEAWYILTHIPTGIVEFVSALSTDAGRLHVLAMDIGFKGLVIGVSAIIVLESVDYLHAHYGIGMKLAHMSPLRRSMLYVAVICTILLLGAFSTPQQFIYFQF
jgi:alginate O-acetyltransferase complex protein AlgI